MELPENTGINEYAIELIDEKQLLYGPIYTHHPVELETLKIYIKLISTLDLFRLLSTLQVLPYFLIKSLTVALACVLIIEVSITRPSRIDISFRL